MRNILKSAAAAAAAVLLCACGAKNTSAPEFHYSTAASREESAASSAESSAVSTPESSTDIQASAESTIEDAEKPENAARASLVTSHDPKNRVTISFDGFTIYVEGRLQQQVELVCLASEGRAKGSAPEYSGGDFSVQFTGSRTIGSFDTLMIYTETGVRDYRIAVTEDGFLPVDIGANAADNTAALNLKLTLPEDGVKEYISFDLDPQKIAEALSQVQEISDTVCANITDDYEKLRALAQWVSDNIYYDYDARNNDVTPETLCLSHVLETHRTVCGGFSTLFAALCQAQGLECFNIRGRALNTGISYAEDYGTDAMHEWNYAVIDGRGIWIDTVWNTSNAYSREEYRPGRVHSQYFDPTDEAFALDHHAQICEYRDFFAVMND
ncbi:MAG: transglutaminase domain-containing protein [Oscillospiraceae bacterium]